MSTAIQKRKSGKRRGKGNGKVPVPGDLLGGTPLPADAYVDNGLRGEARDLPLEAIATSSDNPRKDFPEDEIRELAATIQRDGLLSPILVRPRPGYKPEELPSTIRTPYYELIAGERRFRAAKVAGLRKIPCVIRTLSDAEARELRAVENAQRKDLTAIEEARQYRAMLDAGDYPGPTELARTLGLSQGHVSNRLRLLELPAKWVDRIDSGVLPPTHARALVSFKDHPEVLAAVEQRSFRKGQTLGSVAHFEGVVEYAVRVACDPMSGHRWNTKAMCEVPIFTPTPEQEQRLRIVEVDRGGPFKPERWAVNRKFWAKLQAAHAKEFLAKRAAESRGGKSKGKAKGAGKGKAAKPPTAAERKAEQAAERARQAEAARQHAKRVYGWKVGTLKMLIARQIAAEGIEPDNTLRLLVYFGASRDFSKREKNLEDLCRERGVRMKRDGWDYFPVWPALAELPNRIDELVTQWLARQFWTAKDGPSSSVPDADVEAIADHLCVDLQKAWTQRDQSGPLWESFWNLHTKQQLVALSVELGLVAVDKSATKAALVKALLHPKKPLAMPKEILKAKRANQKFRALKGVQE